MNNLFSKVNEMEIKIGANGKLPQNVARPIGYEMTDLVKDLLVKALGDVFVGKSGNNEISLIIPNEKLDNANNGVGVEITVKVPVNDNDVYFNVEEYEDKLEKKRLDKIEKEKAKIEKIAQQKAIRELKRKQKEALREAQNKEVA